MTFKGLARIVVGTTWAQVHAPITAKPLISSMPVRYWDRQGRAWHIPAGDAELMHHRLDAAGYVVRLIEPGKPEPPLRLPRQKATGQRKEAP